MFDGIAAQTKYTGVTRLTLASTAYDFKLDATSSDYNGVAVTDVLSYKIS